MLFSNIIIMLIGSPLGFVLGCDANNKCPSSAPCCSEYGYCGSTTEYCNAKCNPAGSFNNLCSASSSPNPTNPPPNNGQCPGPFTVTFNGGLPSSFTYDGPVVASNNRMVIKFSKGNTPNPTTGIIQGYGGTAKSAQPFLYGSFTARMNTARIGGVVTAFIIYSTEKDEIDWEWVGKNEWESQTNYFSKGVEDYTKGAFFPSSFNTHNELHDYGIKWTPTEITWTIDGVTVRQVTRESTFKDGAYHYPETPSYVFFNVWDGGAGAEGTRDWAGGQVNYNDPEYVQNGGYISSEVEWFKFECV